ncbi:MAG: metal-dependent transcriptional regulator, partial [Bacteroidota bacterium]
SQTEENYLKAIFKVCEKTGKSASTNAISKEMSTSAASVTDMLNRLSRKDLIHYKPYKGVTLTEEGKKISTTLIRKHRLWEVFLYDKLEFAWDEVHEMAEQLEHIHSPELVDRLDAFLGHPRFDPHGDPIPDADGNFADRHQIALAELLPGQKGVVVGVQEHSSKFLQYLTQLDVGLGSEMEMLEIFEYDGSVKVRLAGRNEQILTKKVCQHLLVQKKLNS